MEDRGTTKALICDQPKVIVIYQKENITYRKPRSIYNKNILIN